jgi:competence protein ComEC
MQQFNFISVKLTFFLILGILLGYYFESKISYVLAALLVSLIILGIAFKKQTRNGFPFFGIIASITATILGVFIISISNPKNNSLHYTNHLIENENEWLVKIDEVLKPSAFSKRYVVKAKSLNQHEVAGKLILRVPNNSTNSLFDVDDELLVLSDVKTITKSLNPHQFDYQGFLKKKRIYHQLSGAENKFIRIQNPTKTVFGYASNFRQRLIEKLRKENFGEEELGVIQALLLGQRNDISEETYNNYKSAGAVHILAVSGLHIGILLLLLQFVLKPIELLPKGKTIKLIAIVCLLWSFAFIAGLSASIVRAVTMFSFLAYAMYLNRPTNTFNIIALSMFFILLFKPLFLFQVGFQMSYAAVMAIVWVYPKLQRFWYPENIIVRKGWQLVAVSIAAQLGVLPISLFYFHQFPALFFISNLLVIPFLGIILGVGILVLLLTSINTLPQAIVSFYNFLIKSMNAAIEFVAKQEAFVFRDIAFDRIQLIIGYLIAISMIIAFSKPKFKNLAFFLSCIIAFQGWLLFQERKTASKEQLVLTHEVANTMLLKQEGNSMTVFGKLSKFSQRTLQDYKTAERIDSVNYAELKNSFSANSLKLYLMDSLGIYPGQKTDYLVLTQSPKINLERLLDSIQIQKVLVDGSNYNSYVARWKATCLKRKLPFHYTGEKGAYYFK